MVMLQLPATLDRRLHVLHSRHATDLSPNLTCCRVLMSLVSAALMYCRDQRLYKQTLGKSPGAPEPLTPASDAKLRYADAVVDESRSRLIAVQEDHSAGGEAVNSVAAVGELSTHLVSSAPGVGRHGVLCLCGVCSCRSCAVSSQC